MLISSMYFTNSAVFSVDVPVLVNAPVLANVPVTGKVVDGGTMGANEAANVEGIVVKTVGITVWGVVENSLFLDCIKLSNSFFCFFQFFIELKD